MFPTLSMFGRAAGNKFVMFRFSPEKAARSTLNKLTSAYTTAALDAHAVLSILNQEVSEMFPSSFAAADDDAATVSDHQEDVRKARKAAFEGLEHVCRFQVNARQCSRNTVDACGLSSKANGSSDISAFEGMGNMDAPEVVAARFVLDNGRALHDAWEARFCL